MPSAGHVLAGVLVAASITFALRALPFAVVDRLRAAPAVADLAAWMPAGLMAILVVYLLRDVPSGDLGTGAATAASVLLVAALHLWRANALLSIFAGTALQVVLLTLVVG